AWHGITQNTQATHTLPMPPLKLASKNLAFGKAKIPCHLGFGGKNTRTNQLKVSGNGLIKRNPSFNLNTPYNAHRNFSPCANQSA
ncbi:MAG TPA: hypothetical protein VEC93_04850, partial [Anaerolineae bacterium]|nr:hypothetical protein [Anaerolineae bacterium]